MTESNNHPLTDAQNEQTLNSLRNEIESLKFTLKKKEERIASLDVMLNMVMEGRTAERRAFEDLESVLGNYPPVDPRTRIPRRTVLNLC